MNKKNIGGTRKGAPKVHFVNLDAYLRKNRHVAMAISDIKERPVIAVKRVKLPVKKIGKNYIVLSELKDFEPEVLRVPPVLRRKEISTQVLKLAKLMQRIPNPTIQRIGRDILDD